MAKPRDRNHVYLYTVDIVLERVGKELKTKREQVEACNMQQVAVKLNQKLDDVLYVHKVIL